MVTVDFSARGNLGLCDFIYSSIKKQILDGTLPSDSKLPSKRALASHLGVSIITVQNAYGLLISEGFIYSIEKKGFFVTDITSFKPVTSDKNLQQKNHLIFSEKKVNAGTEWFADFTSNSISAEKFPFTLWSHTMRQVLNSGEEKLLKRTSIKGAWELRLAISSYLRDFRNMEIEPEQIVIGAGAESLYSIIVQFLGRDKVFAVENPGFNKTKDIFELNGAECLTVDIDDQGISPELLQKSNAQAVHFSPNHHFPTGIVMPVRRRMELLNWNDSDENHFLIEDDYDSEFRFNGKPLPTLQSISPQSKIIYMNTFSKTLSPSFRIGFMVLPVNLVKSFEEKMGSYSCQVSAFEQFTLARFISEGFYEKHINRMKNYYRTLRNNLIQEIQKSSLIKIAEIQEEEAGLHFLLKIKSSKPASELKKNLEKSGIRISLLSDFDYHKKAKDEDAVFVINYSGLKKENLSETVERMCGALIS